MAISEMKNDLNCQVNQSIKVETNDHEVGKTPSEVKVISMSH